MLDIFGVTRVYKGSNPSLVKGLEQIWGKK